MPQKVTLREDIQVIQAVPYGSVTVTDLGQALQNILALYLEKRSRAVLVIATGDASLPSVVDMFEFAATVTRIAPALRFAIVRNPGTLEDVNFPENVATNRGATVRIFDSEESALEWLKSNPNA